MVPLATAVCSDDAKRKSALASTLAIHYTLMCTTFLSWYTSASPAHVTCTAWHRPEHQLSCCLLLLLPQGAEGEVWLGIDAQSQSMVALKLIPCGAPKWKLDMARREFSMLAQLGPGHLNIVRPLEVVLTSKYLVLITEYVPGRNFPHVSESSSLQNGQWGGTRVAAAALTASWVYIYYSCCATHQAAAIDSAPPAIWETQMPHTPQFLCISGRIRVLTCCCADLLTHPATVLQAVRCQTT